MRHLRPAFTLIELLVVVAIIAVLLSILLPAMRRSRFVAQTTLCVSNHGQRVMANTSYATDNLGMFEASPWPRTQSAGLNPWGLAPPTLPALYSYGLTVPAWFCPQPEPGQLSPMGEAYNVPADMMDRANPTEVNEFMTQIVADGPIVISQLLYWVPKVGYKNGSIANYTPHDGTAYAGTRSTSGGYQYVNISEWPTRIVSLGTKNHPMFSDILRTDPGVYDKISLIGGHRSGDRVESASAAWPDGSARLRLYDEFEVRQDAQFVTWY